MYSFGGSTLALAALLCLLAVAAATGGVADPGEAAAEPAVSDAVAPAFANAEAENETPRHENPDEYGDEGDLDGMEAWLSDSLSSQLGDSAVELSREEYDLAREYIGDDYDDRLGQYVDVAGETEGDGQGDTFEETREEQEQLTDDVEEYRETRDEYEEARDEGDSDRARELARDLEELSERIDDSSETVRLNYDELEEETGIDFSEPSGAVEETNTDVQTDQETVRSEQFVETSLTLDPQSEEISFSSPLVATGEVETADGSTLANEELEFEVENETVLAETDAEGIVTLEYRPTDLSLDATELSVRYVPDSQSAHLGSETTVPVSVEQADPEISSLETTAEAGYGDELQIAGEIGVDGVGVDGVPLAVTIDGEHIGTVNATDGEFDDTLSMPATVPDGDRELAVELAYEDRALASTAATTPIEVRETESTLSVDATDDGDGAVTVDGRLETADGDGVGGEPVQLRLDGTTVGTTTTAADGSFAETVAAPSSAEGSTPLVAAYEGAGSNVAPAEAEAELSLSTADGLESAIDQPVWLLAIAGLALAAVAGGWWYRRRGETPRDDRPVPAAEPTAAEEPAAVSPKSVARALLERADEQLAAGRSEAAVRSGYAAVRRALEPRSDSARSLTHWEFYRDRRTGSLADDDAAWLREVTEGYERAAFGRDPVTAADARGVLERADHLCEADETGVPRVADD